MKRYVLPLAFLMVFILPDVMFSLFKVDTDDPVVLEETVQPLEEVRQQAIRVKDGAVVMDMELDAYVLRVLLGEIPADFEPEALKAQAVATRTYTLRKVMKQSKHDDADVCTDASCCQAFVDVNDYLGTADDLEKMERAVSETACQVLTYQGNLIEATYFSCSGGQTEDAAAVWGTSVPYLQSVSSPGEEDAKHYEEVFSFTRQEFLTKLGLPASHPLRADTLEITYTTGGGVDQMTISGVAFSGTQLRTLLSLPSTAFSLELTDDSVSITTKGYGHRVGMSQYGADAMAVAGKTYAEILAHYYPGTELETFSVEQLNAVFDKAGNL